MKEAEVSLRIAIYYIKNSLTKEDVHVSLDGAHIKTKDVIHFDIFKFMAENHCKKEDNDYNRWQGEYSIDGFLPKIKISSIPGIGDVNIKLPDGRTLYIESKKGKQGKSSTEYSLMREAIGQLMTGCIIDENIIPVVAVPYSEKSLELSERWSQYEQMKNVGIRFMLVCENGDISFV